jgi:hypothetical protein
LRNTNQIRTLNDGRENLISAARSSCASCSAAAGRKILFCLAGFGHPFFGAFLFALRAISNIFPAEAYIIPVFFFQTLMVFESDVAVRTKEGIHGNHNLKWMPFVAQTLRQK